MLVSWAYNNFYISYYLPLVLLQGREGETTLQDIDKVLHDINSDIASNLNNLLSKAVQYTNNTLNTTTTTATDPVVIHPAK